LPTSEARPLVALFQLDVVCEVSVCRTLGVAAAIASTSAAVTTSASTARQRQSSAPAISVPTISAARLDCE
jgi:hypothetical protein